MTNRRWESGDGSPFVAWLCWDTVLTYSIQGNQGKGEEREYYDAWLFGVVAEKERQGSVPHTQRLPYTAAMLERRAADGRDLPEWWNPA